MEDYFLNAGILPALHLEPSSKWPTQSFPTTSVASELINCSYEQSSDCFLNPNWNKSTDQYSQFESAFSSMVSSPAAASNSAASVDSFVIRELIGKLGTVFKSGDVSPSFPTENSSYVGGGNPSSNNSCYSTPLNSPPMMNILNNSPLHAFSTDPGFAERAAKFSCFGSRSLNGRTGQLVLNNNIELHHRSNNPTNTPLVRSLERVSSSPSLNAPGICPITNSKSSHPQMEMSPSNGLVSGSTAYSNEDSCISGQNPCAEKGSKTSNELNSRKRKAVPRGKTKEDTKRGRQDVQRNANVKRSRPTAEEDPSENGTVDNTEERKGCTDVAEEDDQKKGKASQKPPEPPKDYIHVRARRGQATDSHSLAERVRREKISQRMKLLQDLVPGCDKVTGKALMLDEIINYVQSLQRQVEVLSMKLASINPGMNFNKESLLLKDIFQPNGSLPHPLYPMDSSEKAFCGHQQQQQQRQSPQTNTNISERAVNQCPLDSFCTSLSCSTMELPPLNPFGESPSQLPTFCEDDLQSFVQMGFSL